MERKLQKASPTYLLKKYGVNGLTISESMYPPLLRQAKHTHKFASFSFVLSGSYLETIGRQTGTRNTSTIIFHPPEESHSVNFQGKVRILNVFFDVSRFAYIRETSSVLDSSSNYRTETIARLGHRIHQELSRMDNVSGLAMEGLILEILAEASRTKFTSSERKSPLWLKQVKEFLHENFSESLTLESIAKIVDIHPVHLARVFRRQHKCTVGEYIRRLRVEFACRQISTTKIPFSEIALAAGFSDHSHLSNAIKTNLGLTPSEYRKISSSR